MRLWDDGDAGAGWAVRMGAHSDNWLWVFVHEHRMPSFFRVRRVGAAPA